MQILRLPIHTSRLTINHFPFISKVSDFQITNSKNSSFRRTQSTPPVLPISDPSEPKLRLRKPTGSITRRALRTRGQELQSKSPLPPHTFPPRAIESRGVATTDAADDDGGEKKHPPVRAETERERERGGEAGGRDPCGGQIQRWARALFPTRTLKKIPPGGDLFPLFGGGPAGGLGRRLAPTRRPATQISLALLCSALLLQIGRAHV